MLIDNDLISSPKDKNMAEKLGIGSAFPDVTIDTVDGESLSIPASLDTKYKLILFYRGHWWPYCRRQLVGFANIKDQLDEKGVSVVAASVDPLDKAKEVADEVNFPIGVGVTKSIADSVGAWWEERRQIIQPSEFLLNSENKVMISSYSDGPLGRFDAQDVIKLINFYEKQSS